MEHEVSEKDTLLKGQAARSYDGGVRVVENRSANDPLAKKKKKKRSDSDSSSSSEEEDEAIGQVLEKESKYANRKSLNKYLIKKPTTNVDTKSWLRTVAMVLMAAVALGYSLIYLQFLLVPLIFSRFLVYVFQPFINLLVGKRAWPLCKLRLFMPRWSAIIVSMILIIVIIIIIGFLIAFSVLEVLRDFDLYKERFDELYADLITWVESYGLTEQQFLDLLQAGDLVKTIAISVVSGLLGFISNAFMIILFTLYMLADYDNTNKSDMRYYIDKRIRIYIVWKVIIATITAIIIGITLFSIKAKMALLFSFLSFILSFIPNIGGIIATLLPLPFIILDPAQTVADICIAAIIPFTVQVVLSNIIEPKIIAKKMHLPFITVLVCLLFWGYLWGIIGAMLSVPLTVAIKTYLDYIDHPVTKFFSGLIVGDFSAVYDFAEKRDD